MVTVVKPSMVTYAFDSLISKLSGKSAPNVPEDFPKEDYPLFVTWKFTADGYLRGCIGCFDNLELGSGIRDYALTAALRDSRFKPVELAEVEQLSCTVSLLTDFEPCSEPFDWTLENHGIRISFTVNNRRYSGTYLPHVATEQGWTKMETLESLARKAGYRGQIDRRLIDQIHVIVKPRWIATFQSPTHGNVCTNETCHPILMTSVTGSAFSVAIRGQIANVTLPQLAGMDVACKYSYEVGPDWQVASGLEEGFSQLTGSETQDFVLNLPLDCTFKSTNPSGWPRLVIELIGPNYFGADQPRGFCWVMVPPIAGSHSVEAAIYLPKASSKIQSISHWFSGTSVNFADPKQIARANGRELVRVETVGKIRVQFQIITTNMLKFGYNVGKPET